MFFIDFFKTYKEEKKIYERNMLLKAFKDGTITSIMVVMAILIFLTSILSITFLINGKQDTTEKANIIIIILVIVLMIYIFFREKSKDFNNHVKQIKYYRMELIMRVLKKYGVDITDTKTIDLLILEAQIKRDSNNLLQFKEAFLFFGGIFTSMMSYVMARAADSLNIKSVIIFGIIIILLLLTYYILFYLIKVILKNILMNNYNLCNELINDLRLIVLFYSSDNK